MVLTVTGGRLEFPPRGLQPESRRRERKGEGRWQILFASPSDGRLGIWGYMRSGISMPSRLMPRRTTLATLAESTRRKSFLSASSSRRMLKSW